MKLLGWMHRKFRQNSNEPLKDIRNRYPCSCLIGQPSLDDQQFFYQKPNYGGNTPFKRDRYFRKSFAGLDSARADEDQDHDLYYEDESSAVPISDLFDGFLAIGTLGSNPNVNNVPSTPTFGVSFDNITEKETEVTENELKRINDELEKVLVAEGKDDGYNYDSSARNSHVSNGRSSHVSSVTLGGKSTDCPLQGYLFGSAIEMSETTTTTAVSKKENRTSLGELFQKTKVMEDLKEEKIRMESNYKDGAGDKSAVHNIVKKMLKKKLLLHPSAETKLHKILHMFNRKVHPESSATMKKPDKPFKKDNKQNTMIGHELMEHDDHDYDIIGDHDHQKFPDDDDEDIMIFPRRAPGGLSKEMTRRYKSQSNIPPQFSFCDSDDSNGNGEHWIKTDADCNHYSCSLSNIELRFNYALI